jgi:hypothetical protein
MKTPTRVNEFYLEATCVGIGLRTWNELMKGHKRADKRKIDRLIKQHLPDLYHGLYLNLYNPYFYHKTKNYLIMVHSGIEYFIRYS